MQNVDSQNLATQTRWMAILPVNQIFPQERKALSLNLTKFDLPEVEIGSVSVNYLGNFVEIPTKVIQPTAKTIQFSYLVSSDFYQYRILHKWVQFIAYNETIRAPKEVREQAKQMKSVTFPVTVVLLSEFKKPIISIRYNDCWVKQFGTLSLDYQSADEPVIHNFTLAYSNFEFIDVADPSLII
jgi:hypothetical protein